MNYITTFAQFLHNNLDIYNACIATISCIITVLGVTLALSSLRQSRKLAENHVINDFNNKYAGDEFKLALKKLYEYRDANNDNFCNIRTETNNKLDLHFKNVNKLNNHEEVDNERRLVKFFFLNALQLFENGTLSKKAFQQIINKDGLRAMFQIVEVLEWNVNPNYNSERFQKLMRESARMYSKICQNSIS